MISLHAAALDYIERKLPIFPCQPRGKEPAYARGCLEATTDIDRINRWWGQVHDLNIGLATGTASGLFVVDIDAEDGRRTIADLEDKHGRLPPTMSVITGRDGRGEHLYFRLGAHAVRNSAGLVGAGVDVRGEGGYVILPPSIHPSGRAYCWSVDSADDFAVAPDWLHALVDDEHRNGRSASSTNGGRKQTREFWDDFLSAERFEGERHCALMKVAGKYWHSGLRDPLLLCHLLAFYNDARLKPPLEEKEILNAVAYVSSARLRPEPGDGK